MTRPFTAALVLVALGALATPAAVAHGTACEKLERQRDQIHRELRRGYTAERGNRLRERLREIHTRLARECR